MPPKEKRQPTEECGACWLHPPCLRRFSDIRFFVAIMCAIIGVQGAYLGYIVGVLTNIERRFELSSSRSGFMLSMYDIGHTATVLFVGHFLAHRHKPRWTGIGVLLSAVSMFLLTVPNWVFGSSTLGNADDDLKEHYASECNPLRRQITDRRWRNASAYVEKSCATNSAHEGAYAILCLAQILAGVAAAPFNTVAYIYIDENVEPRKSPFYLGLLTSMYAFGPALGFGLSSWYQHGIDTNSPNWIGAWWLGFIVCGIAYLLLAFPIFLFPYRIKNKKHQNEAEMHAMTETSDQPEHQNGEIAGSRDGLARNPACRSILDTMKEIPYITWALLKNPVYSSMVIAWIFGSYLVGGYATYLPKYIETQYYQAAWKADLYAGLISIGSVAVSTACGGYLLARFNISPRRSLICLIITWSVIVLTYLLGMISGCDQPTLQGQHIENGRYNFTNYCNLHCHCNHVVQFDPVCDGSITYFSPCHAGCTYDSYRKLWTHCRCITNSLHQVTRGYCNPGCNTLPIYMSIMFIGFFIGNMFFMTTMMIVLRSVQEDVRSMALSLASFLTNVAGFIPSPVIFGSIIDTTCIVWHSICPDSGNCILYNNRSFRLKYHISNAAFQLAAIAATVATWVLARRFKFPEEIDPEEDEDEEDDQENADDNPRG